MGKIYKNKRLTGMVKSVTALMLITLLAVGNVFAEQITYVFADAGYSNAQEIGDKTINDVLSFTTAKNSQGNAPKYYENAKGNAARFYYHATNGNSITISAATGYQIKTLTINAVNSYTPKVTVKYDDEVNLVDATNNAYTINVANGTQSIEVNNTGNGSNVQLWILSMTIDYEIIAPAAVSVPTVSVPAGTYYTAQTVALACETEGANIYYSINDGEAVLYNAPFTVNETSTVKAYATLGEDQSNILTAAYTIIIPTELPNIAAFYTAEGNANTIYKINSDVTYNFKSGRYVYVQDATAGLLIYDNYNPVITNNYNSGDVISGGIIGKQSVYNGLVEFVPTVNPAAGVAGTENLPIVVSMEDLLSNSDYFMSKLVTIPNCKLSNGSFNTGAATNVNISNNGKTMQMRNTFKTIAQTFTAEQYANVTGFVGIYNNTIQIYPRSSEDIQLINTTLPLTYNFDEEGISPWQLVNGNNINKWYVGKAQGFDNNKLYVSSTNGATNKYDMTKAAVSHAWIPVTMPNSDVVLSFDYRSNGEANDFLQVSILDADADVVAGTLPENYIVRLNGAADFTNYQVVLPASYAGAKKLVFTWNNNATGGNQTPAAIDNVTLNATCTAPVQLTTSVDGQTATIAWTAAEGQNSWTVEYKDAQSGAWTSQNVTTPTITLNNLSTETNYDVRVKANCGDNASVWTNGSFYVPCIALVTSDMDITTGTGTSTSYHPFYAYYMNSWTQVVYPASFFESAGYINSVAWEVNSANAHNYSALKIYMGTTTHANNISNTDWVSMDDLTLVYSNDNGTIGATAGWETYTLNTPFYYNGEDNLVIIVSRAASNYNYTYYKATTGYSNAVLYRYADNNASYAEHPGTASGSLYSSLPNMKVDFTAYVCGDEHCAVPAELAVSNITTDGAKLTWEGDAASYKVSYKTEGSEEWTSVETNNNTCTLSNLADNTNYQVQVAAVCETTGTSNVASATFKTEAECKVPANLTVSHEIANTIVTWTPVAGVSSYEVQYGLHNGEMTSVIVNNASVYTIAALNEGYQYDVQVRAICSDDKTSDWTSTTFIRPAICVAPASIEVSNITTNSATITWEENGATSWTVEYGVAGFAHGEGTTITTTTNSVNLSGLTPDKTYNVYVKGNCDGFLSNWSAVKSFTTECAAFTVTESNPWFEDFEGYTGSGEQAFSSCWETPVKSSYNAPFVYCNYAYAAYSGANSVELKGTTNQENVLVLPEFTNALNTLQLSFFANTTASSVANAGTFEVGYVTDAQDGSTFVALQTVTPLTSSLNRSNSEFYGPFSFADVTANGARMAIHFKSSYGSYSATSWNLDDFTVSIAPNCQEPMNLAASEIGATNVILTWNELGTSSTWNIQYGVAGFELGNGTSMSVTEKPYEITGLQTGIAYDFYVNSVCGEGNESAWVGPLTIIPNPKCTYTIYMHDSYGDGWNNGKVVVAQGGESTEYTLSSGDEGTAVINLMSGISATFTYYTGSYSSENSFEIKDADGNEVWALSTGEYNNGANYTFVPDCDDTPEPEPSCTKSCEYTVVLNDSYGDGWTGDYYGESVGSIVIIQNDETVGTYTLEDGYSVNYIVSLCDSTETQIIVTPDYYGDEMSATITDASGNVVWKIDEGDFTSYNSNPQQVTYTFTTVCGDGPATCIVPEELVVNNVTANAAVLAWTGDTLTTYQVEYRATDVTDWTTTTVTGTTLALNNLTANITYVARVKAVCDVENTYTNEVMFYATDEVFVLGDDCNDLTILPPTTTFNGLPVNNYYANSFSQQIYTPEEVGQSGMISKISFNYNFSSAMTKKGNVKIYLSTTNKDVFATTTDWITDGWVEVYSGSLNCSEGWNEFELATPFFYDGSSNLLVTVLDNSGGYNSSSYTFHVQAGTSYKAMYWQNDNQTWTPSSTGSRTYNRNNIRFNICDVTFNDVALTSIDEISNSCDFTGTLVTINVKNVGTSAINNVEAYYNVNGGSAIHETINFEKPLLTGETAAYTFNAPANMTDNSNVVMAWIELPGDGSFENNIAYSNTAEIIESMDIPFVETFSNNNQSWTILDANNDNVKFQISGGKASYAYNDTLNANDWLITSCIYVPAGRYDVSYDYNANNANFVEGFGVFYGNKVNGEFQLNNEVASHEFSNTNVVTAHNYITVAESGVYYFGIKANSAAGNMGFNIDNFSIKNLINVNVNYASNGTGTPEGAIEIPEGDELTVTILPDAGYHVHAIYKNQVKVRGENGNNASVEYYTFTPNNYDNIYIDFSSNKYEINAIVENLFETEYNDNAIGGTYNPNHEQLGYGATHTGVITLADNYHLEGVYVNGLNVTSDLTALNNNKYQLTLSPIAEDKDIKVVAGLDSAKIIYTVLAGEGSINNTFFVDENTELPAVYTVVLQGYTDLLSAITPAEGYHVESIIIDGVEHNIVELYSFEKLMGTHTVEVVFAKNQYVITTNAFGNGTVTDGVTIDYNPDYVYVFKATPAAGNHIASVLRNNVAMPVADPETMFTDTLRNIISNYDYQVMFASNVYTITANAGNHGLITNPGVVSYNYNNNAVYTITADNGYYISSITIDGNTTNYTQADALETYTHTFAGVSGDHTISATFASYQYTITVNAGSNGAITPGTSTYNYDATPTFTITPNSGYGIVDVTVDGASVGAVTSYTFPALTANHTIAATFAAYQYTITANAGNGGTISPAGTTNMVYGGNQTYTISAATGYHISDVFVDGASVGAVSSYSFTNVAASHTIYAVFETNTYTITVNQPANGNITPSGVITVQYGETPSFVITPNTGYSVSQITVNSSNVINNATHVNDVYTYTLPAVSANQTITATMTAKTYTIAASAGSNGSITPNGNSTANYGSTKTFTITPNEGYVVEKVTVDGMNMGALTAYTFTNIVANHTINATFKMAECEAPTNLQTSYIDSTSAVLNWYHPSATSFDIQYKTINGTFNSISAVSGNSYTLMGLTPGTTYLWQVRANCYANNHSDWTNMVVFTTNNPDIEVSIENFDKSQIKVFAEHQNVHIWNQSNANTESVCIYDMYGKLIYQGTLNTEHEVINLNVAAGTYVVNIATEYGLCNYKVILVK